MLKKIIEKKKERLAVLKKNTDLEKLKEMIQTNSRTADLAEALRKRDRIKMIAEIKKASPSKGVFKGYLDVERMAMIYEKSEAAAVSVITEEDFFNGSIEDLKKARNIITKPILRKDFIIDNYQLFETKAYGADGILLIVSALQEDEINSLLESAAVLGLDAIVEVHTEKELELALKLDARVIGINNRDLLTFEIDIETSRNLIGFIPEGKVVVSESGIKSRKEVNYLEELGFDAVLVGESLILSSHPDKKITELLNN